MQSYIEHHFNIFYDTLHLQYLQVQLFSIAKGKIRWISLLLPYQSRYAI